MDPGGGRRRARAARWQALSKATFSAAERSVAGDRVRQFDADEIVAFARAFALRVSWFFLLPPPWADAGVPARLQTPTNREVGDSLAVLADLVFGDDEAADYLDLRLRAFLDELGPNPLSEAQQRVTDLVAAKKAALGPLSEISTSGRRRSARSPTTSTT